MAFDNELAARVEALELLVARLAVVAMKNIVDQGLKLGSLVDQLAGYGIHVRPEIGDEAAVELTDEDLDAVCSIQIPRAAA